MQPLIFLVPCEVSGNLKDLMNSLPEKIKELIDPRFQLRRVEVDKVTSTSCHLHFHFAKSGLTLEIRLKKLGVNIELTVWDPKGKVQDRFKQLLPDKTMQEELTSCATLVFEAHKKPADRSTLSLSTTVATSAPSEPVEAPMPA